EVLALLVIQANPGIFNYLSTLTKEQTTNSPTIQDPQSRYYTTIGMKLAIASTTLLFAMMAAQAAVLSATSNTDVNLVKRAPNGDDETEQGPTVDQSSSVPAPQTPLTEHEKSRVEELHVRVRNRVGRFGILDRP
ncbi:hypothetical protein BASA60_001125, partial [Batrachochytrium salamandrivorans]